MKNYIQTVMIERLTGLKKILYYKLLIVKLTTQVISCLLGIQVSCNS